MTSIANRIPLAVVSLIVFGIGWQVAAGADVSPALPTLDAVARSFFEILGETRFREAVVNTAIAVAIGLPLTLIFGLVVGVLMGLSRWVEWAVDPFLSLGLSLPLVSVIPLILFIFGLGRVAIVAVIIIYAFPVMVLNTFTGVRNVDPDLLMMSRSYMASRALTIQRVVIPGALGLVLAGVRLAAGRALKAAIIAEQIVGLVGLGGLIQRLGNAFAVADLYAVILFVGLTGVLMLALLGRLERAHTYR